MPQDTAFSSLFFKVLMQMLQWLESPAVEDGPLRAQLKAFAVQCSSRHRISDGTGIVQLMLLRMDKVGQERDRTKNAPRVESVVGCILERYA